MAFSIIIGHVGSDAGYTVIGADGSIHHVPGWNPESMADFSCAITCMQDALQIKTPGVAETMIKCAMPFVQKELEKHVKGVTNGMVVVGSAGKN